MCEHKDSIFFDTSLKDPVENPLGQINDSVSNVAIDAIRDVDPAGTAAFLLKSRAIRLRQFRDGAADIDDISWHILLDLIVATNSGKPVTARELSITHDVGLSTMIRYTQYLSSVGLIDQNIDAGNGERTSLSLTASGDALVGKALKKISREFKKL